MSIVTTAPFYWPRVITRQGVATLGFATSSASFGNNASTAYAWVGRAPVTDSISSVFVRIGATVTVTSQTMIAIQTVSSTGGPSGSLLGTATSTARGIPGANTWAEFILTSTAAVTKGQLFAIQMSTFGVTTVPNYTIMAAGYDFGGDMGMLPWAGFSSSRPAQRWFQSGGLSTMPWEWVPKYVTAGIVPHLGLTPIDGAAVVTTFHAGSTVNEQGMRFKVNAPVRLYSLSPIILNKVSSAQFTVSLWDSEGSTNAAALYQTTVSTDTVISLEGIYDVPVSTNLVLSPLSTYYLGVRADTNNAASTIATAYADVTTGISSAMGAFPAPYGEVFRAHRAWTNGTSNAWTETTTSYPLMHLQFDGWDNGQTTSAAAGMLYIPNMSGT